MNLKDKAVVLTGASSGIGLELLSLLLKKGARVLAVDKQEAKVHQPSVSYLQEDISTQSGVDNVFKVSSAVLGEIDVFIANAGFAYYEGVEKSDWDKIDKLFNTNVKAPIYAFYKLKKIKGSKAFQFVLTGSAMSTMPLPGYSLYSGSKHALHGFFEVTRQELPKHQTITAIYPIATKTSFYKDGTRIPFPSQSAQTVAKHYLKGIEKNKKHIYPSKSFLFVNHLRFLQPLVQKLELYQFNKWRNKYK